MDVATDRETMPIPRADGTFSASGLGCLVIVARHQGLHLSAQQLVHDNVLPNREVSDAEILKCAQSAGLKAKTVRLDWKGLAHLKKALPVIVRLKHGGCMVLLRLQGDGDAIRVVLQDPNADEDAVLAIDRVRFEDVWTGEVILVKRNYEATDEDRPFDLSFVARLAFRERWIVRDVFICSVVLGFLALAPIMFFRLLSDKVLHYQAYSTFFVLCLALVVLIAFETVFAWIRHFLVLHLTARLDVKLATYLFDKVLNLPIDFFERTQVGQVTHDMNQIWKIRTFLVGQVFGTVLDSTMLIFFIPVMFFFSPLLTFIVLGVAALIALWLIAMLPVYRKKSFAAETAEAERGAFLVQTITGIRTVKSLGLDARQRHLFDVEVARVAKLRFEEGMTANLIQTVVKPLEHFAVFGTFALGVYLAMSTRDPVYIGALFAFLLLSRRVVGPLMQMAKLVQQYDQARLAIAFVSKLVNQSHEEGHSGSGVVRPLQGHVEFSDVTFKYKGANSPALENLSFEAAEGTFLGIMGRSGSGKTTITRLLQRLHSNYEGLIKIDGIDVREYDIDYLRHSLGVVLQDNFLFRGSIRENIMVGKSDATFDEVVRAARLAGAEEFIDKLPRGYDTFIYEGSPNLSGGQRQRLAIARALITNPRILILDEATSALDAESEAIVNANISRIAQGRTLIIVSHKLASLVAADAIMVLDGGRLKDIGKHEELLERCDVYGDLWHQQHRHVVVPMNKGGKAALRNPTLVS